MKNRFLIKSMKLIVESLTGYRSSDSVIAAMNEEFADKQLLIATQSEMAKKLGEHREKGRHGWWNKDVCSIEELYSYRQKALDENDHVSVLNFTAMIAAREAHIQDKSAEQAATLIDDHCTCGEAITIELNSSYATRKDGKRPFYRDSDYPERSNQLRCRKCLEWIADTVPAAAYETTTKEQA